LRVSVLPIERDDTLVFATDGIARDFQTESPLGWHPQEAANHILRRHGRDNDDALVLVTRYLGMAP
jgi:hypothetical protein